MEWCRMYALRIAVWAVLLGCGLSFSLPDTTRQDSLTLRDQKLQQLLKSLESYSPAPIQTQPSVKNNSNPDHLNPESSFPESIDTRERMVSGGMGDIPVPSEESIRSYQDFYRVMYGTQEGVNFLRKHGPNGLQQARAKFGGVNRAMDDVRLANAHYLKIRNRARCRVPVPQVIRVKDYYPDPSREYLPRCTILHRCGDATGCCDSDAFHCVPNAIQEVTLHFYTITVGKNGLAYKSDNSIEKLLFQNHTSCQCQPVNDLPRIQDGHNLLLDGTDDHSPKSKCRDCPMPFTSRIYKDGRCGCDCFDHQRPCLRIKRGRDSLPEIERRCVEANHCHIPDCEYGLYNYETGYCPKRYDEQRTHHRRPNHLSHSQRWSFLERD